MKTGGSGRLMPSGTLPAFETPKNMSEKLTVTGEAEDVVNTCKGHFSRGEMSCPC